MSLAAPVIYIASKLILGHVSDTPAEQLIELAVSLLSHIVRTGVAMAITSNFVNRTNKANKGSDAILGLGNDRLNLADCTELGVAQGNCHVKRIGD